MMATSLRQSTRRGHALQPMMFLSSSSIEVDFLLSVTTSVRLTLGKGPCHAVEDVAFRCDEFFCTRRFHDLREN